MKRRVFLHDPMTLTPEMEWPVSPMVERKIRGLEAQIEALKDREEQLEGLLQLTAGMILHHLESGEPLTRNQLGLVVLGAEHLGLDIRPIDKTQAG